MKYKIGQKVVYIGADFSGHLSVMAYRVVVPVPRSIYTIRGGKPISPCNGKPAYLLDEVVNIVAVCPCCATRTEMHIPEEMLRPLQERKNDGEAFVAGLRPLLTQAWRIKVPDAG